MRYANPLAGPRIAIEIQRPRQRMRWRGKRLGENILANKGTLRHARRSSHRRTALTVDRQYPAEFLQGGTLPFPGSGLPFGDPPAFQSSIDRIDVPGRGKRQGGRARRWFCPLRGIRRQQRKGVHRMRNLPEPKGPGTLEGAVHNVHVILPDTPLRLSRTRPIVQVRPSNPRGMPLRLESLGMVGFLRKIRRRFASNEQHIATSAERCHPAESIAGEAFA